MNEMNKEVLHRMCDKIKLSDTQREDIVKKIKEEVSEKKHRSFNVKRLATVMACALILVGATIGVGAKISMKDKVSNVYTKWQDWDTILGNKSDKTNESNENSGSNETGKSNETSESDEIVLNEKEEQIIEDISIDIGYEFKVDGGKIRIDGIMYDSRYIFLMYTALADDGKPETAAKLPVYNFDKSGWSFFIKGKEDVKFGWKAMSMDLDENAEGHQGCVIVSVSPIQHITNYEIGYTKNYNNFSFSQGDVIILTDRKYHEHIGIRSLNELERIYGTLELTKPVKELVFNCENTEGMEVLETVTEIRLSPLSIVTMGDELLRKTFTNDIRYHYFESGDKEALEAKGGYAVKVVKKDGTVAEFGSLENSAGTSTGKTYRIFYNAHTFEKPLDLTEVDHILVWGWGVEYKIPVNVTE